MTQSNTLLSVPKRLRPTGLISLTTIVRSLVSMLIVLVLSNPVLAKNSDVIAAEKRVIEVTSRIVNLLKQNEALYKKDNNALNAMIQKQILPFIDFDGMSKLTLGKHWRSANASQKIRFRNAFRQMLIRSYAKTMLDYSGATIVAGNSVANKRPGYVLIRTSVKPQNGIAVVANYSIRKSGNDWKAYNAEIDGINLVTNFRTNFTREVSARGLDFLIARLEKSGK